MNKEKLQNLVAELINIDELTIENINEFEMRFKISEAVLTELVIQIKNLQRKLEFQLPIESFMLYLETEFMNAMYDYEHYTNIVTTFNVDDHRMCDELRETLLNKERAESKLKVLESLLIEDNKETSFRRK